MKKVLVSIISDHNVPNYLLAKEFETEIDEHILLATEIMSNKAKYLMKTIKLKQQKIITISEESMRDIVMVIEKATDSIDAEYIVNLTGGNKLMALAVYHCFLNKKASIYYLPIDKNKIIKISPEIKDQTLNIRANLLDYLSLYGKELEKNNNINFCHFDRLKANDFLKRYAMFSENDKKMLAELNGIRNDSENKNKIKKNKKLDLSDKGELISFLNLKAGVLLENGIISKESLEYVLGGWLEEYVYYLCKEQIREEFIGINVYLKTFNSSCPPDEFDVIFLFSNCLYVVECKTRINDAIMKDSIIKIKALTSRETGINVKRFIVTMNSISEVSEANKNRAKEYGIKILYKENVMNNELLFQDLINKKE